MNGVWQNDLQANIESDTGDLILIVPNTVNTKITVNQGLGNFESFGFYEEGNVYTNETFGEHEHTLIIQITGGLGSIRLEQVNE